MHSDHTPHPKDDELEGFYCNYFLLTSHKQFFLKYSLYILTKN